MGGCAEEDFYQVGQHEAQAERIRRGDRAQGVFQRRFNLLQLLEIIGDESFGKFNRAPKLRLQQVENVNRALQFIKNRGVNLTNIGAEDIVDGNEKLVLGMLWTLILRFTIAEISEGELTAKEGLLLWCQRKTANYNDVNVKDFTNSWQDGLAFCALIHRHRPDLIDFASLNKADKMENLQLAFNVAEKHLNIPKLLDAEDIVSMPKPDERSIMTYVAQYFHAFSSYSKIETAGRRVGKFVTVMQSVLEMKTDYERRARVLTQNIQALEGTWASSQADGTYISARNYLNDLLQFKRTEKRAMVAEKRELDTLLGNIQTKLITYNLKPYTPPQGLTTSDLESTWVSLLSLEGHRRKQLTDLIRDIKENLRVKFATHANGFEKDLNAVSNTLGNLSSDLNVQLETVRGLNSKLNSFESRLTELQSIKVECDNANIEDNEHTTLEVDDLSYEFSLVQTNVQKKLGFIENQIVARQLTNVTPQQLEDFESTFHHFDKDNSNTLNTFEFKAALAGLDIFVTEEEFPVYLV